MLRTAGTLKGPGSLLAGINSAAPGINPFRGAKSAMIGAS